MTDHDDAQIDRLTRVSADGFIARTAGHTQAVSRLEAVFDAIWRNTEPSGREEFMRRAGVPDPVVREQERRDQRRGRDSR